MTELTQRIKKSLRISHDALDDDIEDNVSACLLLLQGVGISKNKANMESGDKLIQKACELYCKGQYDFNGQGYRFTKAFEGLRDFMALGGDYTDDCKE